MYHTYVESPLGKLILISDGTALTGLYILDYYDVSKKEIGEENSAVEPFAEARKQLRQFFDGKRTEFDLPLNIVGTDFQKKCWKQLLKIPYGKTISYGELARRVGNEKASRAVGMANNRNPICIIIPCHRVIGADGSLTGYGGGLPNKTALLQLEGSNALVCV
ncbi:MAG TPA: methylated-DNA--[protein]-cysteine S-methyltransferase [Planktothrix sp.]|jgi:methylated-DNA-[protein]-cysteine S-methyltransferase